MRILVLGGDGMLGHRLLRELSGGHETSVTLRRERAAYQRFGLFEAGNSHDRVDARDMARVAEVVALARPDVVINAVGVIKQRHSAGDAIENIEVNALLPHRLFLICRDAGARLIQMSTDCVFSGRKGGYSEDDIADATDLYGRTKLLGEVDSPGAITMRTSIIGLELHRRLSLIEWFLAQSGSVPGYANAVFSGTTTAEFARVIRHVIESCADLHGVYHVSSQAISKYALLARLNELLDRDGFTVERDTVYRCDRSLRGERFGHAAGYEPPSWDIMLSELAEEIRERDG